MTNRQKMLGVTEAAYQRGIVQDEFLVDWETFLAKASTLKKGKYKALEVSQKWLGELGGLAKHEEIKGYWRGLTALMPDHFCYTDTYGLDTLEVK